MGCNAVCSEKMVAQSEIVCTHLIQLLALTQKKSHRSNRFSFFLYRQLGEIKTIPLAEPLFVDLEPVFVEIMDPLFFNESWPVYKVNVAILVSVYNEESGIIFYQGYQKQACETQLQAAVCSEGT